VSYLIASFPEDEKTIYQAATVVLEGFRGHTPAWPDIDAALAEVQESLTQSAVNRLALDERGTVLGWIAGSPRYEGNAWEVDMLVVHPHHQRKGIGRALVADLEEQVRARHGLTLWLGTDDEDGRTSLAGMDLYPNPLEHLAQIVNLRGHPYEFYQKVGFVIVGVIPDANGPGKPDIFMAKRL
jgi:aminoglycoside 6'-N-acetyltransferase I